MRKKISVSSRYVTTTTATTKPIPIQYPRLSNIHKIHGYVQSVISSSTTTATRLELQRLSDLHAVPADFLYDNLYGQKDYIIKTL